MEICSKCGLEKELAEFYIRRDRKSGRMSACKNCIKEDNKNNPDKSKNTRIKYNYGISLDTFNEMRKLQNYCCILCGAHEELVRGGTLVVDHDHNDNNPDTNIRGLLCFSCNSHIVGSNTVESAEKVLEYLESYE